MFYEYDNPDFPLRKLTIAVARAVNPIDSYNYKGIAFDHVNLKKATNLPYARLWHNEIFHTKIEPESVTITTHRGPAEIMRRLSKDFGVWYDRKRELWIPDVIAPFRLTQDQAFTIMQDLKNNPDDFKESLDRMFLLGY